MLTRQVAEDMARHIRPVDPEGAEALLSVIQIDNDKDEKPRGHRSHSRQRLSAVETGRLTPRVARLHKIRSELGITVRDLAQITGYPLGSLNRDFYNNRMPRVVEEFLESEWEKWTKPEFVARRNQLAKMEMQEIVDEWSKMLGLTNASPRVRYNVIGQTLELHPLTIERQVQGKRERWSVEQIFRYEQKIKDRIELVKAMGKVLPAEIPE
jgi:transcriptional regulator with XRE-family HTH domain